MPVLARRKSRRYIGHVSQEIISVDPNDTLNLGCFRGQGHLSITPILPPGASIDYQPVDVKPGWNEYGGIDAVITVTKPATSIEFSFKADNLMPYFQPALTLDEILRGHHRPDHVVNSISWYHSYKGGLVTEEDVANRITTGKALAQYRMQVRDAAGNWTWADWQTVGRRRLRLKWHFERAPVYPLVIAPLGDMFGYTTVGGSSSSQSPNYAIWSYQSYTPASSGTGVSMSLYCAQSGSSGSAEMALYTVSPNSFVANTAALALPASLQWASANFSTGPAISTTPYQLVFNASVSIAVRWDTATTAARYQASTFGSWPSSLSGGNNPLQQYSFYATYTGASLVVSTGSASSIEASGATCGGQVTDIGTSNVTSWGTDYGLTTSYGSTITNSGTQTGPFSWNDVLSGLTPNTTYHYRSWAVNSSGTAYGTDATFTTIDVVVETDAPTNDDTTTPTMNGTLNNDGGEAPVTCSFEYGYTASYGLETAGQTVAQGNSFSETPSLTPYRTYHYRAKAVSSVGTTVYGSDQTLNSGHRSVTIYPTADGSETNIPYPSGPHWSVVLSKDGNSVLQSPNAQNEDLYIYEPYVPAGATILRMTQYAWIINGNTTYNPIVSATSSPVGFGVNFVTPSTTTETLESASVTTGTPPTAHEINTYQWGLSLNTEAGGLISVDQLYFTVDYLDDTAYLEVTTDPANPVYHGQANLNGTLVSDGGDSPVTCYFDWGLTASYGSTTPGQVVASGAAFSSVISGLTQNTTYHFRTRAIGTDGSTVFGSDLTFTTPKVGVSSQMPVKGAIWMGSMGFRGREVK